MEVRILLIRMQLVENIGFLETNFFPDLLIGGFPSKQTVSITDLAGFIVAQTSLTMI